MPGMDGFINFNGTLEGSIVGGGGGDVTDVKVRDSQETTFESVVNEQGVAEIDLISYVRRNELSQELIRLENDVDTELQRKLNIVNFSTEEQNTGVKWIDGKDLFIRVIQVDNLSPVDTSQALITDVDSYFCVGITIRAHGANESYSPSQISMYNYQGVGTMYAILYYDSTTKELKITNNSRINACDVTAIVMYTKSV